MCQVAAAFVVAQLEAEWQHSFRKNALFSLANGPMDWTASAAVIALTILARANQEIESDVASLFRELLSAMSDNTPSGHEEVLTSCLLHLPGNSEAEKADLG
jgi:hypothetical protein